MGFEIYDGECVAVLIRQRSRETVFLGVASFQRDDQLGNVLLVSPEADEPGSPRLTLVEQEWRGEVIRSSQYGGRLCFVP